MKQLVIILLFAYSNISAQDIAFSMSLSRDTVLMGNVLEIRYSIENVQGNFEPPRFQDFRIVAGPNSSSQFSMINGKVSQSASYSFVLMPLVEGPIVIEPASLNTGEQTLSTDEVVIFVQENPEGIIQESRVPDIFMESIFSKDKELSPQDSMKMKLRKLKTKKI